MAGIKFETDPDGMLRGISYHDGTFYGLFFDDDANLTLTIKNLGGEFYDIKLVDVLALNITDFYARSIISNIFILPANKIPGVLIDKLCNERMVVNDSYLIELRQSENKFFALESSFGPSVYAICEKIEIVKAD